MTTHRQATVGIFERPEQAQEALLALREARFPADAISIHTGSARRPGYELERAGPRQPETRRAGR